MSEYVIIVGLMAALCIGVVGKLGQTVQGGYKKATTTLSKRVTDKIGKSRPGIGSPGNGAGGTSDSGPLSGDEVEDRPGKPKPKPAQ